MLLSGACTPPARPISLSNAGLRLELPAQWQTQRVQGQTLLFARPAENQGVVPGAYLQLVRHPQREGASAGLDSYVQFCEQQAQAWPPGYALERSEDVSLAGLPARRLWRRWQGPKHSKRELAWVWVQNGYGYQLSAVAGPEHFERLSPQFQRIASSIQPLLR